MKNTLNTKQEYSNCAERREGRKRKGDLCDVDDANGKDRLFVETRSVSPGRNNDVNSKRIDHLQPRVSKWQSYVLKNSQF